MNLLITYRTRRVAATSSSSSDGVATCVLLLFKVYNDVAFLWLAFYLPAAAAAAAAVSDGRLERNSWILFLFCSLRPLFRFSIVTINRSQAITIIGECSFRLFNACIMSSQHFPPSTYEDHILSNI